MAQPMYADISDTLRLQFNAVTREDLINDFRSMKNSSKTTTGCTYTHFIPKMSFADYNALTDSDLQCFCPIRECNCSDAMHRGGREVVELKLLKKVEQTFNKNKPLTIYSLGSGSCYQELSSSVGLAQKGYDVR